MKKAFTLLELVVVIVIIGVLATVGLVQYNQVMEKSRAAEARNILGTLRTLQIAFYQAHGTYCCIGENPAELGIDLPSDSCWPVYYFSYTCDSYTGVCTAQRCQTSGYFAGGKPPGVEQAYRILLYPDGHFEYDGPVP